MNQNQNVFVIDAGNTMMKAALFQGGKVEKMIRLPLSEIDTLPGLLQNFDSPPVIVSSVLSDEDTNRFLQKLPGAVLLTGTTPLPVLIAYESRETLGLDRICNAVAAFSASKGKKTVAIDIGTCIKFDYTDEKGVYYGGSISPGIQLRYRSMHDYTGKLPLIEDRMIPELIGRNTKDAMRSGVMNGMKAEILRLMDDYTMKFGDLTFFVTGGDSRYFEFPFKNNIFASENLTLEGLYQIYLFNAK